MTSITVVGYGSSALYAGASYVDIRFHNATAGVSSFAAVYFGRSLSVTPGDDFTTSVWTQLVAGSVPSTMGVQLGWDAQDSGGGYITTLSGNVEPPGATLLRSVMSERAFGGYASANPGHYFYNLPAGCDFTVRYILPQFIFDPLYKTRATDGGVVDLRGLTGGGLPQTAGELMALVVPMDWNTAPGGSPDGAPYPSCFDASTPSPDIVALFWDQVGGGEDWRHDDTSGNKTTAVSSTAMSRTPYTRSGAWDGSATYQFRNGAQVSSTATNGSYPAVHTALLGAFAFSYICVCGIQGRTFTPAERAALTAYLVGTFSAVDFAL